MSTLAPLSHLDNQAIKAKGVHYTPPDLAEFLAEATLRHMKVGSGPVWVLDPACGDGGLLSALALAAPSKLRRRMVLVGYETDTVAADNARARLGELGVSRIDIRSRDFLDTVVHDYLGASATPLFFNDSSGLERFDLVISNPPYVRTQVLGAKEAQRLAGLFELTGRVDLYHAFVKAIALVLQPGGVLGLLTSNRFMLIQSGASVRDLLRQNFELCELYDLGDTKLFSAAVLPAILVGRRSAGPEDSRCPFTRVYAVREAGERAAAELAQFSLLEALRGPYHGAIRTAEGQFQIERGELCDAGGGAPWSLSSSSTRDWLGAIQRRRCCCFGEIAQVRVGLKTTADSVFIRDDWDRLPEKIRPETELLKPLLTHHTCSRWLNPHRPQKFVLYPHEQGPNGEKRAVNLASYPRAGAYLQQYKHKLEARRYLIEAGRQWYELWVPQQPGDWALDKVVYPDISEQPRFFLDTTGAIVNGDCYWITLHRGVAREWLYLLLAVANSSFITTYYDTKFHNKLYAGRRRFMSQYVREFPLPAKDGAEARKIVRILSGYVNGNKGAELDGATEAELDRLVWSSFGLTKEISR